MRKKKELKLYMTNKYLMYLVCSVFMAFVFTSCSDAGLTVKDDDEYILLPSDNTQDTEGLQSVQISQTDEITQTSDTKTAPSFTETEETKTAETTNTPDITDNISESITEEADLNISETDINNITLTAESLIGIPFADGGSSPESGFDNSGFIYYVLKQNGYVNCPRGLSEQSEMGVKINSANDLKSGDLVFFSENKTSAQFGGIYKGGGVMISCQSPGQTVKEIDVSTDYYVSNFFTGVRVL